MEFERRKEDGHPNFLDVIRMYRREFDMSLDAARDLAIEEFDKRGWQHPFERKT
jgi:hypothetical protein